MPQATKGVDITPCTEGTHILQLMSVEEDRINSKFPDDVGDGKSGVWFWKFKSKTVNEETGEREQVRHMTSSQLTPNNNQMKFWKMLVPAIQYETMSGDTEEVEGKWFQAEIVHETRGDKTYASIAFIKPYNKKTAPAQVAKPTKQEEEEEDPFADE